MRRFLHSLGRALDIAVLLAAILTTIAAAASIQAGWIELALLWGALSTGCWILIITWIRSGSFLQPW